MSYVIETGIPVPRSRFGPGGNYAGPKTEWTRVLASLEVGQSVLTTDYNDFKSAEQYRLRSGRKMAIRKVAGEGWRVWRTE